MRKWLCNDNAVFLSPGTCTQLVISATIALTKYCARRTGDLANFHRLKRKNCFRTELNRKSFGIRLNRRHLNQPQIHGLDVVRRVISGRCLSPLNRQHYHWMCAIDPYQCLPWNLSRVRVLNDISKTQLKSSDFRLGTFKFANKCFKHDRLRNSLDMREETFRLRDNLLLKGRISA